MRLPLLCVSSLLAVFGAARTANAAPTCTSVAEFNAFMAGVDGAVTTLELQFDVTGVNPADFFNSKGCLAELDDERCSVGAGYAAATLKVYGTADPPNTSHPPGTLKFEYGNECCATAPCGEHWASPNPSATVFAAGTEHCTVTVWLNPNDYGYHIVCGTAVFDAVGDNVDDLRATRVSVLSRTDGGWAMPNAVSTWNQICYEPPVADPVQPPLTLPVIDDITASAAYPAATYPDAADLSVEHNDSEIYLKFDLSSVPGLVESARIALHRADGSSSEGDGGDAYLVPDNSWSETTLTWNTRPAAAGGSLARVSPVSAYDWYTWDVTTAIAGPGVHSFVIAPRVTDTNGAHFFSKEGSSSLQPVMWVEYSVVDGDGDGVPAGPDCDDDDASVHPGADEPCNGTDDDCNGVVDDGCDGGAAGSGPAGAGGDGAGQETGLDEDEDDLAHTPGVGCACRAAAPASPRARSWLLFCLSGILLRRRRKRPVEHVVRGDRDRIAAV